MKHLFLVALLLLFVLGGMAAQDEPQIPIGACGEEQYNAVADLLEDMAAKMRTGEQTQQDFINVQVALGTIRAFCDGYVFTSEEYGADVVTDIISFRDGAYRAVFESDSFGTARLEEADGDCGFVPSVSITSTDGGQDQDLWQFEGCLGILNVSANEAWTLRLEPIAQNE